MTDTEIRIIRYALGDMYHVEVRRNGGPWVSRRLAFTKLGARFALFWLRGELRDEERRRARGDLIVWEENL